MESPGCTSMHELRAERRTLISTVVNSWLLAPKQCWDVFRLEGNLQKAWDTGALHSQGTSISTIQLRLPLLHVLHLIYGVFRISLTQALAWTACGLSDGFQILALRKQLIVIKNILSQLLTWLHCRPSKASLPAELMKIKHQKSIDEWIPLLSRVQMKGLLPLIETSLDNIWITISVEAFL